MKTYNTTQANSYIAKSQYPVYLCNFTFKYLISCKMSDISVYISDM